MKRILFLICALAMSATAFGAPQKPLVVVGGQIRQQQAGDVFTPNQLNLPTPSNVGLAPGPTSGTAGSIAQMDWLWNNGAVSATSIGGLWPGGAPNIGVGFSRTYTSGTAGIPQIAVDHLAVNNGSAGDAVSTMSTCYLKTATGSCFGQNIIAYSDASLSNAKLVGLEVDIQPGVGTTLTGSSNGLVLNTWAATNPASAASVNVAAGGKWAYGYQCAFGSTTYACIDLPQGMTNGIELSGSTGHSNAGAIYNSSDIVLINSGVSGFAIKDQAGSVSRLTANASGVQVGIALQLPKYAVASLPTCNAGAEGTLVAVSDATSATFNATLAGGGANHVMAYCNGTGWTVH